MNRQAKIEPAKEPEANPNLRIWNTLSKTDPSQTKQFSRAGGFKGTAVKPMWVIKRLTEEFGPCGSGWGVAKPEFQVVPGIDEVLVFCTVHAWYDGGEEGIVNNLHGVGGDKVVTKRNDGKLFHDDEAFKKAFTDAVNNAFKFIGVAADIHMGLFDDSKYLADLRTEFEEREKIKGIHKIKDRLRTLRDDGDKAQTLDDFNALIAQHKTDLKTIRDANHEWWTGDGEDFEGFAAWKERRKAELAPREESLAYQLLVSTLDELTSENEYQAWLAKNGDVIGDLDGEESRKFEELHDAKVAGLKQLSLVTGGA